MSALRFVVIRPIAAESGQRIILHVDSDGVARIDHERVLPERVLHPDALRVTHLAGLELSPEEMRWLAEHLPTAADAAELETSDAAAD